MLALSDWLYPRTSLSLTSALDTVPLPAYVISEAAPVAWSGHDAEPVGGFGLDGKENDHNGNDEQ